MICSNSEGQAIAQYLRDSGYQRSVRRRLFERAGQEPERVLIYLDSLPEGVEEEDEISQQLRRIATAARNGMIILLEC